MKNLIVHGDLPRPANVGGLLPRGRISIIHLAAAAATNVAALAEIAAGIAADPSSTALAPFKVGEPRRSLAGLLRAPTLHAAEPVVIVTAGAATGLMDAVAANALARGVTGHLPIAAVRAHPSPARDEGLFNSVRAAHEALGVDGGGAIVVIADFEPAILAVALNLCSSFPSAAIVVASTTPADIPDEFIGARLAISDDGCAVEPAPGASIAPFSVAWAKCAVMLGSDEIAIVAAGARRAWAPPMRERPEPAPLPAMKPKPREPITVVYLLPIASTRVLTTDERDLFGDSPWTGDRLHALRLAAGVPGPAIIAVCHAPDREADGRNADADVSRLTAEIRHQNLAEKIVVERAPFGICWHGPAEQKVA